MNADDTLSEALAAIYAHRQERFTHLRSNGVHKRALDDFEAFLTAPGTLSRPSLIVRCHIANLTHSIRIIVDKPISQSRLSTYFVPFLRSVLPRTRGQSEFFVLLSDNIYVAPSRQLECLEHFKRIPFCRCDEADHDELSRHSVLFPDLFMQDPKYADELAAIEAAVAAHPFERRIEQVMWRGSLHGSEYANDENFRRFPRFALLETSLRAPNIVDARLTNYNVEDTESGVALRRRLETMFGHPAPWLPAESFVRYKFLISVDGVGAGWKRVATILASGSVLLLQHRWKLFFYPGLKPWVHYVPLKDDISDLTEHYEWLRGHPSEAQAIARRGRLLARSILTATALRRYAGQILDEFSQLYRA